MKNVKFVSQPVIMKYAVQVQLKQKYLNALPYSVLVLPSLERDVKIKPKTAPVDATIIGLNDARAERNKFYTVKTPVHTQITIGGFCLDTFEISITNKKKIMKNLILGVLILLCYNSQAIGQALHLYGGNNHDVYLGCLNCNNYDKNSIWNEYGTYGNPYNQFSIWNEYGTYGNPYNSYSPWNEYGSNPPVIVDVNGNFYGYFTINYYKPQRANSDLALIIYKYFDLIRENIDGWYNKIFQ